MKKGKSQVSSPCVSWSDITLAAVTNNSPNLSVLTHNGPGQRLSDFPMASELLRDSGFFYLVPLPSSRASVLCKQPAGGEKPWIRYIHFFKIPAQKCCLSPPVIFHWWELVTGPHMDGNGAGECIPCQGSHFLATTPRKGEHELLVGRKRYLFLSIACKWNQVKINGKDGPEREKKPPKDIMKPQACVQ